MTTKAQGAIEAAGPKPIPVIVRTCVQCGALDRELPGPVDDPAKHFVTIEMRHLEKMPGMQRAEDQADPRKQLRLKSQGWKELVCPCHGQKAIQRVICMDCLNSNEIAGKLHREYQRDAARLERQPLEENFYAILCD